MDTRQGLVDVVSITFTAEQAGIEGCVTVKGKIRADKTENNLGRASRGYVVALELTLVLARDGTGPTCLVVDHATREGERRGRQIGIGLNLSIGDLPKSAGMYLDLTITDLL